MSDGANRAARSGVNYVLYCFNGSGERLPPELMIAEDDGMAIDLIRLQLHAHCELWQGNRLVFMLPEIRVRA